MEASTCTRFSLNASRKVWTTEAASPLRSMPLSTKTQVSWLPIARCTRTATTEESTPPDSAQSTRSRPTWVRIASVAESTNDAMDHWGLTPHTSRKF